MGILNEFHQAIDIGIYLDFDEWGKHLPLQKQQKSRILYPQFEPLK